MADPIGAWPIVLRAPRLRLTFIVVLCWAMASLFVFGLFAMGAPQLDFARNETLDVFKRLALTAALGLILLLAVPLSWQLLSDRPSLVIDDVGLSGAAVWVVIRWEDVARVRLVEYAGERYVGIDLRDEADFLANKGWLVRVGVRTNTRTHLPHFCVVERLLPRPAKDVVALLQQEVTRRGAPGEESAG